MGWTFAVQYSMNIRKIKIVYCNMVVVEWCLWKEVEKIFMQNFAAKNVCNVSRFLSGGKFPRPEKSQASI